MTLPLFERARKNAARVAIRDASGSFTYGELLAAADRVAGTLAASCESAGTRSLQGPERRFSRRAELRLGGRAMGRLAGRRGSAAALSVTAATGARLHPL